MTWRHENQQVVEQPKCNFQKMTRYIRVLEVKVFAITMAGGGGTAIALQPNYKIPNPIFSSQIILRKQRVNEDPASVLSHLIMQKHRFFYVTLPSWAQCKYITICFTSVNFMPLFHAS